MKNATLCIGIKRLNGLAKQGSILQETHFWFSKNQKQVFCRIQPTQFFHLNGQFGLGQSFKLKKLTSLAELG